MQAVVLMGEGMGSEGVLGPVEPWKCCFGHGFCFFSKLGNGDEQLLGMHQDYPMRWVL
jgi:hypothetical protein